MTEWLIWPIAMLCLLPLMRWGASLRVWSVMLVSSIATWWIYGPIGYMAIDLLAALAITATPRGTAQRAIGAIYTGMVLFHIGYLFSPQNGAGLYTGVMIALGWLQWLILLAWGVRDVLRITDFGRGIVRRLPDTVTARF